MESDSENIFKESKTKDFKTGTVIYEKSATGQIIANVIPKKRKIRKPPVIQEMKNCPIDESNVENVLDRMVLVTESLQQLLQSYKDDLKKTGGGFVPRPSELKPHILKKRLEIAEKLTSTYATYRQAVDDIAEVEIGAGEILKQFPLTTSYPVHSPPSNTPNKKGSKWPKIEVKTKVLKSAPTKDIQPIKKSQGHLNRKPFQTANNNYLNKISNNGNNSIKKPTNKSHYIAKTSESLNSLVNSKTTGSSKIQNSRNMTSEKTKGFSEPEVLNVSNDLLMSCENCVDEDVYAKAKFLDEDYYDSDDSGNSGEMEGLSSELSYDSDLN